MPLDNLPNQYMSMGSALLTSVPNPFYGIVQYGTLSAKTVTTSQLLRPYPQFMGVGLPSITNGDSSYNSLQAKLERRFSNGISILASYTHAKSIGTSETQSGWLEAGGVASYQDPTNLKGEKSLSSFSIPDRFVMAYNVDIPVGNGRHFSVPRYLNPIVGGWGLQGINTFSIGLPLHFTVTPNTMNNFGSTLRPNVTAGCNKNVASTVPQENLGMWFNTSCFTKPASFTFGSEGRNDPNLQGNGQANFDLSFYKSFPFGKEGAKQFQFRAELFNLFNSPQFSMPGQSLGNAQFGVVSGQANSPRLVQLALRVKF